MTIAKRIVGYHVEITPRRLGNFGWVRMSDRMVHSKEEDRLKEYKSRCEDIVQDVKRHVDDVEWVGVVEETEDIETEDEDHA